MLLIYYIFEINLDFSRSMAHTEIMSKFKPGDIVEFDQGRDGKVVTVVADIVPILYAVDPFDSEGTVLMYEHQLRKAQTYWTSGCECGSKHDRSFPHVHSFWCPRWRDINE
jgi:hypothetical protein